MNIKITADSTCDLSPELVEKYGVEILPLYIVKEGKSYKDMKDIVPQDIFDHVNSGGAITTTAAINAEEYSEYFTPLSAQYDAVIHINISSEFSSCHQNARIAAEEFDNVYIVDSRNLSTGSGHIVVEAAIMAQNGATAEEIVEAMNSLTSKVEASFVVDKLDYLRKGGRCSALAALGANLLSLRPCIEVKDGKMGVGKKYRGKFEACIEKYVVERLEGRDDIVTDRIFITHTPCDKAIVDAVRKAIKKHMQFTEIIETSAGCTVSSHCGPNTLGILFIRK
ncbi:MAG: DegV family protein [Ruminococcaceae bacterium]|nr:DegV family protein [Oscillospiraceae bacterium]